MRAIILPSPPREAVWATLLLAGVAYEIHELMDGPDGLPLTRVIRRAFRTDTPAGRIAFTIAVQQTYGWLVKHILIDQVTTTALTTTTKEATHGQVHRSHRG